MGQHALCSGLRAFARPIALPRETQGAVVPASDP